jgi:hypothetical protein
MGLHQGIEGLEKRDGGEGLFFTKSELAACNAKGS